MDFPFWQPEASDSFVSGDTRFVADNASVTRFGTDGGLFPALKQEARARFSERAPVRLVREVERTTDFWQATVDSIEDHVAVIDEVGTVVAVNAAWRDFAAANGGGADVCVGADYFGVCERSAGAGDRLAAEALAGLRGIVAGDRELFELLYPCDSPTEQRWFRLQARIFVAATQARSIVVTHRNVTEAQRLNEQTRFRARLLDGLQAAVIALDADGCVTEWNKAAEHLYGWSREEALGCRGRELLVPDDQREAAATAIAALQQFGEWIGDFVVQRRDGSRVTISAHNALVYTGDGGVEGMVGIATDMTGRIAAEHEIRGVRDFLRAVTDSLGEGLFALDDSGRVTYVNDTAAELLGFPPAELLGVRMHDLTHFLHPDGSPHAFQDCPIEHARTEKRVMRVDDDVFVRKDGTLLPVAYTASPFKTERSVTGSVIVFRDVTVQKAEADRQQKELDALGWVGRVREALADGGLVLHSQPIVSARTREQVGEELLLRLVVGEEIVAPGVFLPPAQQFGLMGEIDRWVIRAAIKLAQAGKPLSINLSAGSLVDSDVTRLIEREIRSDGIDAALLTFEVTETAIIADEAAAKSALTRLRELGCKIALDDFGSGYGGFHYLKHLPVDFIKIDREFVGDIIDDRYSRHVVEAIVSLARGFGVATVAEGVESAAILELLSDLGVDCVQGYFLGRPMAIASPNPTTPVHERTIG